MAVAGRLGVVVPTFERPQRLRELLESLRSHLGDRVGTVVVVDDSTTPTLRSGDVPGLEILVLRSDRRTFISEARQRGLAAISEEFVFVVDDDNVVDASTVVHPLEVLLARPKVAAVMPSVLYRGRPDLVWVYGTPFRPDRWGFVLLGRNRPRDPTLEGRLLPTDALPNAALYRTDALRSVGGWDLRLPVNSSADLCRRLKASGWEVWADSHAFTHHAVEPPGRVAYWAEHSIDADRLFYEMHDWYLYQRRIHGGAPAFVPRALWHSAPFLASSSVAFLLRNDARLGPLLLQMVRGVLSGLREPA